MDINAPIFIPKVIYNMVCELVIHNGFLATVSCKTCTIIVCIVHTTCTAFQTFKALIEAHT